ncbi:hypothetical protein, partial [Bradyrhizobium genomosp. III]|uniref:hypothetical protein n=1 Tax=Bradyrhizobium genomosp. III TaxID=2683271 RepID=UPI001AEBB451
MIVPENRFTLFRIMLGSMRVAVALPQLFHELLEMGRELGFGTQALLEPFAHRIANRTAGPPVDLLTVIGKKASHRAGSVCSKLGHGTKSLGPKMVSPFLGECRHSRQNCMSPAISA